MDIIGMTRIEKAAACDAFFKRLSELLEGRYEVLGSCNNDTSRYLIPIGTENEVTYTGKPAYSFRISDHWNWYANVRKCPNESYIQCLSADVPYPRKREEPGKPTKARIAYQVAFIGNGGRYHAVYGEVWNRKTKTWEWLERRPEEVLSLV